MGGGTARLKTFAASPSGILAVFSFLVAVVVVVVLVALIIVVAVVMCACVYVCMYNMYVCTYVSMYACTHVCMHACMCVMPAPRFADGYPSENVLRNLATLHAASQQFLQLALNR